MTITDQLLASRWLWEMIDDDPTDDQVIFRELMANLEAYGTPLPCLYELPPSSLPLEWKVPEGRMRCPPPKGESHV